MCGIAGIVSEAPVERSLLKAAADMLAHRGPDESSVYTCDNMGFAHSRLSIVDLEHGNQPAFNEDQTVVVIFNGEIYNHVQLKRDLVRRGHQILNRSDTAVLPHLYEEYGEGMFERLDGQFSIALWDSTAKRLLLARDRIGKLPLFYAQEKDSFVFGSEVKAVLLLGNITPELSGRVLQEIFTYWAPVGDDAIFQKVKTLLSGQVLIYEKGKIRYQRYWQLQFRQGLLKNPSDAVEQFEELIIRAVGKRMMGDVPISTYLSGGLDSSLTSAVAAKHFNKDIDSFSITFNSPYYDESYYQQVMADSLGTRHHTVSFSEDDFVALLKKCVYHCEVPFLRTGPLPMMKLSKWVHQNERSVVLTGEGSDELFGGYDLFREVKIRDFCKREPDSSFRGLLYKRINQFIPGMKNMSAHALELYYNSGQNDGEFGSHLSRWRNAGFFKLFLTDEINACNETECHEKLWEYLPAGYKNYTPIQKAQQLEIMTFLERYLLSTQGDRVSMANSVECRYPFLDNDLIDYATELDDRLKIKGLNEKYIVRQVARKYLPDEILQRRKFPYRAPVTIQKILKDPYFQYVLEPQMLSKFNIFKPEPVEAFLKKAFEKNDLSERELMLFMGVVTTQTLCDCFSTSLYDRVPVEAKPSVKPVKAIG